MKTLVLLVITVIVVVIPKASSLRCHACISTTSDLDCYQNRRNEDCYQDEPHRCARASYKILGKQKYYRGCLKASQCPPAEYCKTTEGKTNCITDCCYGDFCNASSKGLASGIVVTFCTLVASLFVRW